MRSKFIFLFFFTTFTQSLFAATAAEVAQGLITEANIARKNPASLITDLESLKAKQAFPAADVDEAIAFLKAQKPLQELKNHPALTKSTEGFVADQGPRGTVGHDGKNGDKPSDRIKKAGTLAKKSPTGENCFYGPLELGAKNIIAYWIVDSGTKNRGHRKALFTEKFTNVGTSCGPHNSAMKFMCVMDFSGEIK